jgi:hypothetical protein
MDNRSMADRWRGRHLFKLAEPVAVRHSEDAELGRRLLAAGFDVVFDPTLQVISGVSNTRLATSGRRGIRCECWFPAISPTGIYWLYRSACSALITSSGSRGVVASQAGCRAK